MPCRDYTKGDAFLKIFRPQDYFVPANNGEHWQIEHFG
jgi:hypothetical protein